MVPSPSLGISFLPAGRFRWRNKEKLKEGKAAQLEPQGEERHVSNVITMLLCWSVVGINQRIPLDASAPPAAESAVPQCPTTHKDLCADIVKAAGLLLSSQTSDFLNSFHFWAY